MRQYLKMIHLVMGQGDDKSAARENMPGTTSVFGHQFRHNLAAGFPLLTTKEMHWKSIVIELMWFLRGDTNVHYLNKYGVRIWNQDAYRYYQKIASANTGSRARNIYRENPDGSLSMFTFKEFVAKIKSYENASDMPKYGDYVLGSCGIQYGRLWRGGVTLDGVEDTFFGGPDQITDLIKGIIAKPMSRDHIVTAWNPGTLDDMALHACHAMFQVNCRPIPGSSYYKIDLHLYQRSADTILGVPFNIASYALLIHILCQITRNIPGDLIVSYGDLHIYENHYEAVARQVGREPFQLPTVELASDVPWLDILGPNFDPNHLLTALHGYKHHPKIEAELSTGLTEDEQA